MVFYKFMENTGSFNYLVQHFYTININIIKIINIVFYIFYFSNIIIILFFDNLYFLTYYRNFYQIKIKNSI